MAKKRASSSASRSAVVVMTIIFLWCFGVALLIVILNMLLGFADNDAEFRTAFLSMTEEREYDTLQHYLELTQRSKTATAEEAAIMAETLQTYQQRYNPQNTNLRFQATDSDGKILLTNDPQAGKRQTEMASDVYSVTIITEERDYTENAHFDDPLKSFSEIVYGDNSRFLRNPEDYQLWFFSDDDVDNAYHQTVPIVQGRGPVTGVLFFDSEDEAKAFDYTGVYGRLCTWEIVAMSAKNLAENEIEQKKTTVTASVTENSTAAETGTRITQNEESVGDGSQTVVKYTYYDAETDFEVPLAQYYEMKNRGKTIVAADPVLEEKLMSGLDITIRGLNIKTLSCDIRTYLPEQLTVDDTIKTNYAVFHSLFRHGEWSVIAMFAFLVLSVVSGILMCSWAVEPDEEGKVSVSRVHGIIFELYWLLPALTFMAAGLLLKNLLRANSSYRLIAVFSVGMVLCISACSVLWLYTTAVRTKTGTFWSSFGVARVLNFLFSMLRVGTVSIGAFVLYSLFIFLLNVLVMPQMDFRLMLPVIALDILTVIGMSYCIYSYFELHRHVRQMETGDFSPADHAIPLGGDFSRFDRSLNEITDRVSEIVAKQTKAEHLRTELITNVSHDLKTPLTSIVNYVDLLSREPMASENAAEYLDVLKRQAAKLKKLTVDLVDASKASTGNLTVELMPTDIQVLLSQLAGEYEGQLADKSLSMVMNAPEEPIMILADGRHIWRVFDNLLNNAGKYALAGTRIYLDVRKISDEVEITLKNVSAMPLNISPDALMERFVRGDASRHTEGSGLGLSIAKDLTALQNGKLLLETDGDLFKAILRFPIYHPPVLEIAPGSEQLDAEPQPEQLPDTPEPKEES